MIAPAILALLAPATAPQELVLDIHAEPPLAPASSDPIELLRIGSRLYFNASSPEYGPELWVVEEGAASPTLFADTYPGDQGGYPLNLFDLGDGRFLFTSNHPQAGRELWISDGTSAGTSILVDIYPGIGSSNPQKLRAFGGEVFFYAGNETYGIELWKTDGTPGGTQLVVDTNPGPEGLDWFGFTPDLSANAGSLVFSSFLDATDVWSLWSSDGTTAGSLKIGDLGNTQAERLDEMVELGAESYFAGRGAGSGLELWKSDGTLAGTGPVADIHPGGSSSPENLFVQGGHVYFAAEAIGLGRELWRTDGTAAGTELVIDMQPGGGFFTGSSNPYPFAEFQGQLVFAANDPTIGPEFFLTDGTAAGTTAIADIIPGLEDGGSQTGQPPVGLEVGGTFVFVAKSTDGIELWATDGTPAGTYQVKDINPGAAHAWPTDLTAFGAGVWFAATDDVIGTELWSSDLTAAGTQPFVDLDTGPLSGPSNPTDLTRLLDLVIFSADDGIHGGEPWITDGTAEGTQLLADLNPGPFGSEAGGFKVLGDKAVFFASTPGVGTEPWVTDGTAAGTQLLADLVPGEIGSGYAFLFGGLVFEERLYFNAFLEDGFALVVTDGTPAGTQTFFSDPENPHYDAQPLVGWDGHLYLSSTTPETGLELYRTDGTPDTIELVADTWPGPDGGFLGGFGTLGVGDTLFFGADDGVHGAELWTSDGTPAGSQMVLDLAPGPDSSTPNVLVEASGRVVYFVLVNGQRQVAASDGTAVGTLLVTSFTDSAESTLASNGERAFFLHKDPVINMELWTTDGTLAGTTTETTLPTADNFFSLFTMFDRVGSGPSLVFGHDDLVAGKELWTTDGTAAGTGLALDVFPGPSSSDPGEFVRLNGDVLFAATGPYFDRELFRVPMATLGEWAAEPFGPSCPVDGPELSAAGVPAAGGSFDLVVSGATGSAAGLIAVGTTQAYLPVLTDCIGNVADPFLFLPIATDATGTSTFTAAVSPLLAGFAFQLQALVLEPGGPATTNGLELVVAP